LDKRMAMNLALAQYPITYHKTFGDWQIHTEKWVAQAAEQGADLLVFPEYGAMELVSTFSIEIQSDLQAQLIALQPLLPAFQACYRDLAAKYKTVMVAPSFPVWLNTGYVNRAYVYSSKGEGYQDKWFMTRFEDEIWKISSGEKLATVFETDWGRFGVQICFDTEFPVGAQALMQAGVDLIVAPSCTETIRGATRVHVGARARAMEQQIYIGVAQTIGEALWSPAVDINYGYAAVYSSPEHLLPEEGVLALGKPNEPQWLLQPLEFQLNNNLQTEAHVFNRKAMQRLQIDFQNEEIAVRVVRL
jgi:predicted amidohydrolase